MLYLKQGFVVALSENDSDDSDNFSDQEPEPHLIYLNNHLQFLISNF